ncbi:hypothetical protein V6N12_016010 [Hibiscus sabdariffa]|uniref:Uncharacterized protein n=1 Tax=Hibiscus sabdariffa TaxID=183260 RepID=A0ABR2DPV8_9ROSI
MFIPLPNDEVEEDESVLGGGSNLLLKMGVDFQFQDTVLKPFFPRLDYTLDPPVQTDIAKDVDAFLKEGESSANLKGNGKVRPEAVLAVVAASHQQPFEVAYYPRASTPEFCVAGSWGLYPRRHSSCGSHPMAKFTMATSPGLYENADA